MIYRLNLEKGYDNSLRLQIAKSTKLIAFDSMIRRSIGDDFTFICHLSIAIDKTMKRT
jgi:hypothetical protein